MKKLKTEIIENFHAVAFMRKQRRRFSKEFLANRDKYLKKVREITEKFKEEKISD